MRQILAWALLAATSALAQNIDDLSWMAGCWEIPGRYHENWMKPVGGTMLGMSRTIRDGKTVLHEYHLIRQQGAEIALNVLLAGAVKAVPFKLIRSSAAEAVFENPEHDFPQRIIYRKESGGLFARIEGTSKGKERSTDVPMKRASCE